MGGTQNPDVQKQLHNCLMCLKTCRGPKFTFISQYAIQLIALVRAHPSQLAPLSTGLPWIRGDQHKYMRVLLKEGFRHLNYDGNFDAFGALLSGRCSLAFVYRCEMSSHLR